MENFGRADSADESPSPATRRDPYACRASGILIRSGAEAVYDDKRLYATVILHFQLSLFNYYKEEFFHDAKNQKTREHPVIIDYGIQYVRNRADHGVCDRLYNPNCGRCSTCWRHNK